MREHLQGKVALVTNPDSLMGRAIALGLARQGATVIANASRVSHIAVVDDIKKLGGSAIANAADIATVAGGDEVVKLAVQSFGRLDIVVHVHEPPASRTLDAMTEEAWDAGIKTYLKSMFCITRPATAVMRQQKAGMIIGFSSLASFYGDAGQAAYGAATDGIAGLLRTVAKDMARYGITANTVVPSRAPDDSTDLPALVAYLCTNEARFITGQIFYAHRGQVSVLNNPYAFRTMEKRNGRWDIEEIAALLPAALGNTAQDPALL